jgi:uncharacterized protein
LPEVVVADTSVLQYLFQADHLDLLRVLYGSVLVPEGVAEEIDEGRALGHPLPDLPSLEWVRVEGVRNRRVLLLALDLGKGEREVLALTLERPGAVAILDDLLARRMARHLGIPFTGTLGVLLRAKAAGHLAAVTPVVDRLQALGFRLASETRSAVLELAGEAG